MVVKKSGKRSGFLISFYILNTAPLQQLKGM